MDTKYKKNSKKVDGSILIYFLFFKLLIFIFVLTILNVKRTNEKIYRLRELHQCHKVITDYQLNYLSKQQTLNYILRSLSYFKKIPKLSMASTGLIEVTKYSQEILFYLKIYRSQFEPKCFTSVVNIFKGNGLLKRKILFQRNKKTHEIIYRKKSTQTIYSKKINFLIRTNYFKKDTEIVTKSTLKKYSKIHSIPFIQRTRPFHL